MRIKSLWVSLLAFIILSTPVAFAETNGGDPEGATVSGTIKVVRTKAKTEGPKSYRDVVVYLDKVGGGDYPAPSGETLLDQKGLVFIPHVMAVQKGMSIDFHNSDNDDHNVYFLSEGSGETLDLGTWSPGASRSHTFKEPDSIIVLCKLHLEMAAYIVVLDTPYFTMASIDGETQQASFSIENVPPGKYLLKAWHKKLKLKGGSHEITVEDGKATTLDIEITKEKYAK